MAHAHEVVSFAACKGVSESTRGKVWHRRLALQLTAQLPDETKDAAIVVDLMKELLEDFMREGI